MLKFQLLKESSSTPYPIHYNEFLAALLAYQYHFLPGLQRIVNPDSFLAGYPMTVLQIRRSGGQAIALRPLDLVGMRLLQCLLGEPFHSDPALIIRHVPGQYKLGFP